MNIKFMATREKQYHPLMYIMYLKVNTLLALMRVWLIEFSLYIALLSMAREFERLVSSRIKPK